MSSRSKGSRGVHQSQSFAELVGKTNRENLKGFIVEQMGALTQDLLKAISMRLTPYDLRIAALEEIMMKKLSLTQLDLTEATWDVQDGSFGAEKTNSKAEKGDLVRLTLSAKAPNMETFGKESSFLIKNLGSEQPELVKDIEDALIGMNAGETKEVSIQPKEDTTIVYRVTLARVSRRPRPSQEEAPTTQEAANEQA